MDLYGRVPGSEISQPDPDTGLEESMWQLGLGGGGDAAVETVAAVVLYPERPGEPDCAYYMRTGTCGYGERCRYNHPRDRTVVGAGDGAGVVRVGALEYPERVGQPVCQYFLRTGTCKFGSTCKYHHPRQESGSAGPVSLNYYGYPLRLGEKECSYYVRTGHCKFGSTCKFHHPEPGGVSVPSAAPAFYPTVQSPSVASAQPYASVASWQVARPSVLPASYMQAPYGPMLLSPGVVPVPGWSPYPPPASSVVSPGGEQTVQAASVYGLSGHLSPSGSTYPTSYPPVSSPAGPSSSSGHKENIYPERPGQPECQYYLRTGECKFGSTCRYHHPPGWSIPKTNVMLNPMGLPLRPGAPPCTFYAQHGICKFGPTCKFDHPMGAIAYSPSGSSLTDVPLAPYPIGISLATLAPSSSSSELRPQFSSNRENFSTRMPSVESLSSGTIGSLFSKGGSSMAHAEKSSSI